MVLGPEANVLYFWPPGPIEGKASHLANSEHLVELKDCATSRSAVSRWNAATARPCPQDCTDCLVAGNTIRNAGDHNGCGVKIEGGRENGIVGNDIRDVGADGVYVAAGDPISLTRSEVRVDNNYIHHVGRVKRDAKGVGLALAFRQRPPLGCCAGVQHHSQSDSRHAAERSLPLGLRAYGRIQPHSTHLHRKRGHRRHRRRRHRLARLVGHRNPVQLHPRHDGLRIRCQDRPVGFALFHRSPLPGLGGQRGDHCRQRPGPWRRAPAF